MTTPYFPAFLRLAGRPCVVVGAGHIARDKIHGLLQAGADVTVIAPEVAPDLAALAAEGALRLVQRRYRKGDLAGAMLVIAATADARVNRRVHQEGEQRGCLVNVVDHPSLCHYITPSIVRRGALTIAISTQGIAPALAALLRRRLERMLDGALPLFLEQAALLRRRLARTGGDARARRDTWYRLMRQALPDLLTDAPRTASGGARQALQRAEPESAAPRRAKQQPHLGVIGADLLAAPLEQVESLATALGPDGPLPPRLATLRNRAGQPLLAGWVIVTAPGRADVLYQSRHPRLARAALRDLLGAAAPAGAAYSIGGAAAMRHVFTVAAGLRAPVPGAGTDAGALRSGLDAAGLAGHATPELSAAIQAALRSTRATRLTAWPGLAERAVAWLSERVPGFGDARFLLHGTEPWCNGARVTLAAHGVGETVIAAGAAANAAPTAQARVVLTDRALPPSMIAADGTPTAAWLAAGGRLWILDAALPRVVPPALAERYGVTLWNLADLTDGLPLTAAERARLAQARRAAHRAADRLHGAR